MRDRIEGLEMLDYHLYCSYGIIHLFVCDRSKSQLELSHS